MTTDGHFAAFIVLSLASLADQSPANPYPPAPPYPSPHPLLVSPRIPSPPQKAARKLIDKTGDLGRGLVEGEALGGREAGEGGMEAGGEEMVTRDFFLAFAEQNGSILSVFQVWGWVGRVGVRLGIAYAEKTREVLDMVDSCSHRWCCRHDHHHHASSHTETPLSLSPSSPPFPFVLTSSPSSPLLPSSLPSCLPTTHLGRYF